MVVKVNNENDILTLEVSGRIETSTVEEFDAAIEANIESAKNIVLDMKELEYISSAGLRSLIIIQDKMDEKDGKFTILNPNDFIMEILDTVGYTEFLNIKSEE